MPDDALAKAAYRAWKGYVVPQLRPREVDRVVDERWSDMTPAEKGLWCAIARAVLEAAGAEQTNRTCATCKWWERDTREHDPKTGSTYWWGSCHASSERMEVEGDQDTWTDLRTREDFGCVCYALQRAGKG